MAKVRSILIVGGSGFVGTQLALHLRDGFKVFATHHLNPLKIRGVTSLPLNIDNRLWIKTMLSRVQPDIMIYAVSSGHDAESTKMHVTGAANLMSIAEMIQPRTIYLSNPYVFEGRRGNYKETDILLPQTSYGKTKFEGENLIRARSINSVIVRSSPLLGRGNGYHFSFMDYLRFNLDRGKQVNLPNFEAHSFVSIVQFKELIEKIINSEIKNKAVHLGGRTKLTHYQLGQCFARHMGYDEKLISPAGVIAGSSILGARRGVQMEADYSLNFSWAVENLKIEPLLLEQSLDLIQKKLVA